LFETSSEVAGSRLRKESRTTITLGVPPVAGTSRKTPGPPEPKTIVFPFGFQVAPVKNPSGISQIRVGTPPSTGTRISTSPEADRVVNPTTLLSGDQNGLAALLRPSTTCGCS